MEPVQYTGKANTPQGDPSSGDRPTAKRGGGNAMRIMIWGAVLVILVAGLVMYFRYERAVVPLFGGGR